MRQVYALAEKIPELKVREDKPFLSSQEFVDLFHNPDFSTCVATDSRKGVVGFAVVHKEGTKYGSLMFIAVEEASRGQGVATELLKCAERSFPFEFIYLNATNENVVRWAQRHGYVKGKTLTYLSKDL